MAVLLLSHSCSRGDYGTKIIILQRPDHLILYFLELLCGYEVVLTPFSTPIRFRISGGYQGHDDWR